MSEKRFTTKNIICSNYCVWDNNDKPYGNDEVVDTLNEQQATIRKLQDLCGESDSENARLRIENKKLKAKLKEKEEDERLYANEIVELRKTNQEWLQFKDLGGDY